MTSDQNNKIVVDRKDGVAAVRVIKAADREKNIVQTETDCSKLSLDELRTLIQDVRRRLNTIDEKLEQACELTKQ